MPETFPPSAFQYFARHVNPPLAEFVTLSGRGQHFIQAEGCTLTTREGDHYQDWIAGFGSFNLGHNPLALIDALADHIHSKSPNLYVESLNPFAGVLAAKLVQAAGNHFETCFFSNSGSEAIEAGIKLAIAATGRRSIAYADGAYHGTTFGALSMMNSGLYRNIYEPLLPGFYCVRWNDLDSLSNLLEDIRPAAFVLEPIQIESGLRSPDASYLRRASEICKANGTLLILDEVQTGMGRTGSLFGFQNEQMIPDVLVLGKSIGGGLMPIGATLMASGLFQKAYGDYRKCEMHNSTFGGNALACRAAIETLSLINRSDFLSSVQEKGGYLEQNINEAIGSHALVSRIYLKGLLGGITLQNVDHPWFSWKNLGLENFDSLPVTGPLLVHRMHRRKILMQVCAHDWNTVRIEPPLIVSKSDCNHLVSILKEELDWIKSNS